MISNLGVVAAAAIFLFVSVDAEEKVLTKMIAPTKEKCSDRCVDYHRVCPEVQSNGRLNIDGLHEDEVKLISKDIQNRNDCSDHWLAVRCLMSCKKCTSCESKEIARLARENQKMQSDLNSLESLIKDVRGCSCNDDECNECRHAPANHWDCNGKYYDKDVWQPANVVEPTCKPLGDCKFVHTTVQKRSAQIAREYCEKLGGHLAEPMTTEDMSCFLTIGSSSLGVFFGQTDVAEEGVWRNAAGIDVTADINKFWNRNEPNGGDKQDCIFGYSKKNAAWGEIYDLFCDVEIEHPMQVICVSE